MLRMRRRRQVLRSGLTVYLAILPDLPRCQPVRLIKNNAFKNRTYNHFLNASAPDLGEG
jgi:hypothetical protein